MSCFDWPLMAAVSDANSAGRPSPTRPRTDAVRVSEQFVPLLNRWDKLSHLFRMQRLPNFLPALDRHRPLRRGEFGARSAPTPCRCVTRCATNMPLHPVAKRYFLAATRRNHKQHICARIRYNSPRFPWCGLLRLVRVTLPRYRSRVRDSSPAPKHRGKAQCFPPFSFNLPGENERHGQRRDGRVVMQRPAKPCTSVRFRVAPPNNSLNFNGLRCICAKAVSE